MDNVRLAFIGAGQVNFGGGEGPWNHAHRFERIPGVVCVGVADVDQGRAESAINKHRSGPVPGVWEQAAPFDSWREMVDRVEPDAVVIGLPPSYHGQPTGEHAVEVVLAERGISMLVEKPLSSAHPDDVVSVAEKLRRHHTIVSVGYMFRYAKWVQRMRRAVGPAGPNVLLARYDCAYSAITKADWWDSEKSGGPIIEQATHFLDLARYFCGEVDLSSIQVTTIAADSERGQLRDIPTDPKRRDMEQGVPVQNRIPRATLAQWRFVNGAIGSLCHGVQLQGRRYEAELEGWADGVRCVMRDPYDRICQLDIRKPGDNESHRIEIEEDDPYETEAEAFIDAMRRGCPEAIRSNYDDAVNTYRLSWEITRQCPCSTSFNRSS